MELERQSFWEVSFISFVSFVICAVELCCWWLPAPRLSKRRKIDQVDGLPISLFRPSAETEIGFSTVAL